MKWLVVLVVLVGCGPAKIPAPAVQSATPDLLANGNGHDFLALSDRDRMELCIQIEGTIGQKEAYDYCQFLFAFYEDNPDQRSKPIAEVAAIAAAME